MKKSRSMRLASALLVCTLLSTCMISGTFAKYTTQDSGKDEARVAKWGVELQVGGDLYGEDYIKTTDDIVGTSDLTVSFNGEGTNLVAPGTKSETGFDFSLNGTPEVSGTVTTTIEYENIYLTNGIYGVAIKADGVTADNFTKWGELYVKSGSNENATYTIANTYTDAADYFTIEDLTTVAQTYYPVEYQMTGKGAEYNKAYDEGINVDTLAEIVKKIGYTGTPKVDAGKTTITWTEEFTPNTDLAAIYELSGQQISWKWDICNDSTTEEHVGDKAKDTFCGADTVIGNLQAGANVVKSTNGTEFTVPVAAAENQINDYNLETSFKLDITVTQVD